MSREERQRARLVEEWTPRTPEDGLTVSLDGDGGITIMTRSGVVLSIIERSEGLLPPRPGYEPFVSVEVYPYEIGTQTLGVAHVPAEQLRNPRIRVSRYWIEESPS